MTPDRSVAAYRNQQVMTSSPARLVLMAYERTIVSLQEAVAAIERGDIESRWRANKRAIEIIGHLGETLDIERGGEIALNLAELYRFILARLVHVDLHDDPTPAVEAIRLLTPLRDSWAELANGGAGEPAPVARAGEPVGASLSA